MSSGPHFPLASDAPDFEPSEPGLEAIAARTTRSSGLLRTFAGLWMGATFLYLFWVVFATVTIDELVEGRAIFVGWGVIPSVLWFGIGYLWTQTGKEAPQ